MKGSGGFGIKTKSVMNLAIRLPQSRTKVLKFEVWKHIPRVIKTHALTVFTETAIQQCVGPIDSRFF